MGSSVKNTRFDWGTTHTRIDAMRESLRTTSRRSQPAVCFIGSWFICGVLSVLVPVVRWMQKKNMYLRYTGYNNNYQQQQGYQQQGRNYRYNNNSCMWYNWNCKRNYYQQGGSGDQGVIDIPGWYRGWSDSEEEREMKIARGRAPGSLGFVYVWQLIMFAAILAFGAAVLKRGKPTKGLLAVTLMWANLSFLSMWMLAAGAIETEERALERVGFFGQFAALMFMTNFWYTLFGVGFSIAIFVRNNKLALETNELEGPPPAAAASKEAKGAAATGYTAPSVDQDQKSKPKPRVISDQPVKDSDSDDDDFIKVI